MTASRRRLASCVCLALLLAATLLPGGPLLLAVLPDGAVLGAPELLAGTIESFGSPALERPAGPHRERGPPAA